MNAIDTAARLRAKRNPVFQVKSMPIVKVCNLGEARQKHIFFWFQRVISVNSVYCAYSITAYIRNSFVLNQWYWYTGVLCLLGVKPRLHQINMLPATSNMLPSNM